MKRWLGSALVLLALTGCSGNALQMSESDYYEFVRDQVDVGNVTDQQIADLGESVCTYFETEDNPYEFTVQQFESAGATPEATGSLIAASVFQYCPERADQLPD